MLTQTTCLITYALPFADWKKYQDNLQYNKTENVVLTLFIDGRTKPQQQLLLDKIDFDEKEMKFTFEGTYNGEAITGYVQFNKNSRRYMGGSVHFG